MVISDLDIILVNIITQKDAFKNLNNQSKICVKYIKYIYKSIILGLFHIDFPRQIKHNLHKIS